MEKKRKDDYLRIIYELGEKARSVDLARSLKISKASVSEMLRKLAKNNLVKLQPYSKIILTNKGIKHAKNLSDRHFIIKKFVEKFLEHDEPTTLKEAHKLEHALSEESIKIISEIIKIDTNLTEIKLVIVLLEYIVFIPLNFDCSDFIFPHELK